MTSSAVFYVRASGILTTSPEPIEWPSTYSEFLAIEPPKDRAELVKACSRHWRIYWFVERAQREAGGPWVDWDEWLPTIADSAAEDIRKAACSWLESKLDHLDLESATRNAFNGQGEALHYFSRNFAHNELFHITIHNGAAPDSFYYAAELGLSVEDANGVARANGIPIRFVRQDAKA